MFISRCRENVFSIVEQIMRDEIALISEPYGYDKRQKQELLTSRLKYLTNFHMEHCVEYKKIMDAINYQEDEVNSYEDLPFLPVRIFKERVLKSVPGEEVIKTMTSSGTTGQAVSKIYLDKTTAAYQQKTLVKIVSEFTGTSRMPMIIIDCPSVIKNRKMFSARGAGILGFSIFGSKKMYALDDDMNLNLTELKAFIERYKNRKILLFGFTFMIWQHFYKELVKLKEEKGEQLDLSNAILIHGGGWKKMESEAVSSEEFRDRMTSVCGLSDIHDYYGMVEQTGCIYMQCECGHLHASIFSDVIIRNPKDFSVCPDGQKGIIQVVSAIPESYPGHSLLTEDEGVIIGEDDCPCGRKGKYFKVFGRLKNAEIRGCSDTYAVDHSIKHQTLDNRERVLAYGKMSYLVGDIKIVQNMSEITPMCPFSQEVLAFLEDLSKDFMTNKESRLYPDIITLGFWLRKSSLHGLKKKYLIEDSGIFRIGRGVAFHIAPSNVPVNFAYSLFTGLLTGNANIVRVPSKDFPQVRLVSELIEKKLCKYKELRPYIALVKYERDQEVNELLSSLCDVRVIWGGDATIKEIRRAALLPRATEITFADRYSLAVIDADYYLEYGEYERVAQDFYNDTYLSDQNACTSPRVIIWYGNNKEKAKEKFWDELETLVEKKYHMQAVQGVEKLVTICKVASADEEEKIGNVHVYSHTDNRLIRIKIDKLTPNIMEYRGNSGYFYEYDSENLMDLREFCNDSHCQTLGYIGKNKMLDSLLKGGLKGIDRVVSVGHTMDFDFVWDGYHLVDSMTRTIAIR